MSEVHVWDMGLVCRFFYAPGGTQWGAERFVSAVREASEERGAAHVILAVDAEGPTWREQVFPRYKAHRPERDPVEDAALKATHARAVQTLSDATVLSAPGWEADDVVATAALACTEAGFDCAVFSSDKDMGQLLTNPDVRVFDGHTAREVTCTTILAKFGVLPSQVVDYLAIAGDTCDGVPGVPGLGPKAAQTLLRAHVSLESALSHAEKQDVRFLNGHYLKLRANAELARLCRRLVTLDAHAPVSAAWPWLEVQP